ncbi:MAG: hypothetical protein IPJ73_02490 [Zoogloea sp.]|nr:hypothetical protein [Zoogloea sp.]
MPEIDLIPASWRAQRKARRTLRGAAVAMAGLVIGIGAARIGLEVSTRNEQAAVQAIQATRRDGDREAARLSALQARHAELQRQEALIATLRGPGLVGSVLQPLDRALEETACGSTISSTPGPPCCPSRAPPRRPPKAALASAARPVMLPPWDALWMPWPAAAPASSPPSPPARPAATPALNWWSLR